MSQNIDVKCLVDRSWSISEKKWIDREVSGGAFAEISYLMEIPELGGTIEKVDVTTLSDSIKRYIPGVKDYGDPVFKFLYDNSDPTANYCLVKSKRVSKIIEA